RQLRCGHEEVEPSAFPLVSAAHEFKTPLVVMLGYTDLLLNGHLGAVNQRQKQVLGEIQEGAQRLQKLIQDLLLLQELKAGRVMVSVTPCFWERRKAQSEFLFNMERKETRKVENAIRIDVSDTGRGIAPEHHDEIFGDFVQLPGGSARGTGLGLAIARRLVE